LTCLSNKRLSIIRQLCSSRLFRIFRCFAYLAVFFFPLAGQATEIDTSTARLTHAEFIKCSLEQIAEEILVDIGQADRQITRFVVQDGAVGHRWVNTAFVEILPFSEETTNAITCRVYKLDYSLAKKTHHRFLGPMWVRRELQVGMIVTYPPVLQTVGGAEMDFERIYTGWFRASDSGRFRSGEFSSLSTPPASDFVSRWVGPVAVGTGLGLLTYLFFSIR
jgi:hypothetical protein